VSVLSGLADSEVGKQGILNRNFNSSALIQRNLDKVLMVFEENLKRIRKNI
jgi:hypothetical protein